MDTNEKMGRIMLDDGTICDLDKMSKEELKKVLKRMKNEEETLLYEIEQILKKI